MFHNYTAHFTTGATGEYSIREIDGTYLDISDLKTEEAGTRFELPDMKFVRTAKLDDLINVTKSWAEPWNLLATKVLEEGVTLGTEISLYREGNANKGWKMIEVAGVKYAIKSGKYIIQ